MAWHPGYQRKSDPNRARTQERRRVRDAGTTFIGVDGEGWTDGLGVHRYSQLSVGEHTLFGTEHLSFLEVAEFLWECFLEQPRAAYVGFYLGYDFSQWFRTLPEDRAKALFNSGMRARVLSGGNTVPFPVRYRGWEFDVLGDKRFKLRKHDCPLDYCADCGCVLDPWMYICDTGPFFQCSFLKVIDPKEWPDGSPASEDEYRVVLEGKSHRADDWTADTWAAAEADLTRYNVTENILLSRVMERYEQGLMGCGVRLKRDQWYGPGAAAQAWMGHQGVASREDIECVIPSPVLDFARESYYGGWFEVFAHGIVPGKSFEFDINSAYPAAMAVMPEWTTCEHEWLELGPAPSVVYHAPPIPSTLTLANVEAALRSTTRAAEIATSLSNVPASTASALTSLFRSWDRALYAGLIVRAKENGSLIMTTELDDSGECCALPATWALVCSKTTPNTYETLQAIWRDKWDDTAAQAKRHPGTLALMECTTSGTDPLVGSMLHRRKDGTILRPSTTTGVRWAHEVAAGIAAGIVVQVQPARVLLIRPTGPHPLNEAIPTIYQERLRVGKNTAHGKAFKLIYNSAYGKQAQSVGLPKFSNALSASFITSWCRTRILEAIASHPGGTAALLMVATDGVYFRSPHPSLDLSPGELGKWDTSVKQNMTIVMPGVYYDDASRECVRSGGFAKVKSRGIPAAAFAAAIEKLDVEFLRLAHDPTVVSNWPVLDVPIKFQVQSPRLALHQGKWNTAGTVSRDVDRKMNTDPKSKRIGPGAQGMYLWADPLEPFVQDGVIRTRPYKICGDGKSAAYNKRFGMEEDERSLGLTPDGHAAQELFMIMEG